MAKNADTPILLVGGAVGIAGIVWILFDATSFRSQAPSIWFVALGICALIGTISYVYSRLWWKAVVTLTPGLVAGAYFLWGWTPQLAQWYAGFVFFASCSLVATFIGRFRRLCSRNQARLIGTKPPAIERVREK